MSEKADSWKLQFRQDEIETLLQTLHYVDGRHDWALGSAHNKVLTGIDEMAHRISQQRVKEIIAYIELITS